MDLLKIYRACLIPENREHLLDWYQPIESVEFGLSYKECFCKCTQINLSLKDDPNEFDEARTQYLCFDCAQKLKNAYDFIEKAKKANKELCCTRIAKVKLEGIANNFEWVPVETKEVKINKLSNIAEKSCIHDMKIAHLWNEHSIDDNRVAISEDIEHGNNLPKKFTNDLDEHYIDEIGIVLSNEKEHNSTAHENSKKLSRSKVKCKSNLPKKSFKRMEEVVKCEECEKTMTRKALRKHKPRHKPKVFLCQACPKTFSGASGLKNHELIHKDHRERYPCEKCNQTFVSPYSYKKHIQTHENNRKPMYQCTQCDKSFLHKNGLTIHELHHKGATIECNICQKRYVRQIDLDTHLRTHSGEAPFACNICGKSFIHKRILNRHLQYHEGYFSYSCLTCGAKFSKYDKYYSHRMQHTGLPYKCGSCEKQFPDAYKIKRHIRGVHKVEQNEDVEKLVVRINITKEHRGRIVEVLKNPEDVNPAEIKNQEKAAQNFSSQLLKTS